jgi:two-component system OmpR family response regulator
VTTLNVGVCEDDPSIRRVLHRSLEYAEHRSVLAHTGAEALRLFPVSPLHVIVMDIGLPDADGRDVVQGLKAAGQHAPVLFLTALGAVHERLSGFAVGAEDYVAKPFSVKEVLARIDVLGRRGLQPRSPALELGFDLNPMTHSLETAAGSLSLTPTEFRILAAIAARPGEVVRRRAVIAAGWPDGAYVAENTLDSFLSRLRNKLEIIGAPVAIETVRGVGFRLR